MAKLARKPILIWGSVALLVALLAVGGPALHRLLGAGTGIMAKNLCSAVFVSGRDSALAIAQDAAQYPDIFTIDINDIQRSVEVGAGWRQATATHYPGLGCIRRVPQAVPDRIGEQPTWQPQRIGIPAPTTPNPSSDVHLSRADAKLMGQIDTERLNTALADAFHDAPGDAPRLTRAVVIVWRGMLIAERYADNIKPTTPLTGWSMTKSLTNALVGMRVLDGALTLQQQRLLPQWQGQDDLRGNITLDALLRMSSGLAFNENYFSTSSDAVSMLFGSGGADMAGFAASKAMAHPMDTHFAYSSGTTNILQRIVRNTFASTNQYLAYVKHRLLDPLGMHHTQLEPDQSGTLVGSSFGYASARDWAKFGQLYLQQGNWQNQQLLPPNWVHYSTTASPTAPEGNYGAQWWLNHGTSTDPQDRPWPSLPRDAYRASGFEGQSLMIIPSADLVIVRLGLTVYPAEFDIEAFSESIIQALP